MKEHGYRRDFAAGCIAGSSVLGLLIPPSVFMIVWAIQTEQSIGRLFAGGLFPGLLLATLFGLYCVIRALITPAIISSDTEAAKNPTLERPDPVGIIGVFAIIILTLGRIWGSFSPRQRAAQLVFLGR
jgi:C4-dicarboxylate transporter, DctM subunit